MSGDFCFCSGAKRAGCNKHADVICYNSLLLPDYCMSHVVRSRKCGRFVQTQMTECGSSDICWSTGSTAAFLTPSVAHVTQHESRA